MPTQLRPNWVQGFVDSMAAPTDLTGLEAAFQPVPDAVQSATIIEYSGEFLQADDTPGGDFVVSCWEATLEDDALVAGPRQIGATYTLTFPAIAALDPVLRLPFVLRWIDTEIPQSGAYMIAYDAAVIGSVTLGDYNNTILTSIGP